MPERGTMIYCHDGSFEGLLCCVFESYEKNELPLDVLPQDAGLPLLLPIKHIETDLDKAARVESSIPEKLGEEAYAFVRNAFLTCHPQKDLLILKFLRLGYRFGPSVLERLADDTVHALTGAVRHLTWEAHHYKGFVRFSEAGGVLCARIEPKNNVLPLMARHFMERFPEERFLIYDQTHGLALIYDGHKPFLGPVQELELPAPDAEELQFRALWRLFYNTIEIKGRHNPRCRMSHMPKRFWNCLTEFTEDDKGGEEKKPLPALPGDKT